MEPLRAKNPTLLFGSLTVSQLLFQGLDFESETHQAEEESAPVVSIPPLETMSHCVPDWDGSGGELDAVLPTTDFTLPVKGKWELSHKRSHLSDLAFVPTHDAIEPEWADEGHVVAMQGHSGKGNKAMWQQMNYQNAWSTVQESEDAVTPVKPVSSSSPGKEPVLVVNEPAVDPHHANTLNMQEDEMVSWLQYPLDDSLERNYCSEFFGELPNSNISNMQLMKDSFGGQNQAGGRNNRNPGPVNGSNSINSRVSSADAAMAMGAGRAAGLLPQTGVEAFTKVRTTLQYGGKWSPSQNNAGKTLGAAPSTQAPSPSRSPPMSGNQSTPMLPPKSQGLNFQPPRTTGPMNFSHFSRPAAVMKASLQCLGMSHGVAPHGTGTNVRLKSQSYSGKPLVDGSTSSGSSIAESTTTRQRSGAFRKEQEVQVEASEAQQSLGTESSWPSMQNSLSGKDADAVNSSADGVDSDSKPGVADADNCRNSSISDSAVLGTEKHQSQRAEVQEAPEPTITSSSGGSGNSAERGKEAASSGKRRTREGEESECQSEVSNLLQPQVSQVGAVAHRQDGEDEMAQLKKPQQRGSTTKRSRAAEVHNLSERRRRDRINEKMKALQELIPNSNKTDKASMLDEAIEYLKMLQLQLQMMSMRSGMSIPSMVMPAGMQHLQIPQLPQMGPMPPMGMGMGMGMGPMGMGMSMMDMGGGAPGRPMMSLPSHSGPSHSQHNVSATSPAVSVVDTHDHRLQNLQNPSVMESLNVFMAQHRQMQMAPQPISMDAFNAYMMHHQQQQHHQQHQQHQQHQLQHQHQHSLHHLPSNMGGGAPQ